MQATCAAHKVAANLFEENARETIAKIQQISVGTKLKLRMRKAVEPLKLAGSS